ETGVRPHAIRHGEQFRKNKYVAFHKHKYKSHSKRLPVSKKSLKIALLTYGFWPQQAGMEMMVHNLAQTFQSMGHDCHLFAPRVSKKYTEIEHDYSLTRFRSERDLKDHIRRLSSGRAFDVI